MEQKFLTYKEFCKQHQSRMVEHYTLKSGRKCSDEYNELPITCSLWNKLFTSFITLCNLGTTLTPNAENFKKNKNESDRNLLLYNIKLMVNKLQNIINDIEDERDKEEQVKKDYQEYLTKFKDL